MPAVRRNPPPGRVVKPIAALVIAMLGTAGIAAPASATPDDCTPSDAWTETIPAQGQPHIWIDNPAYSPEIPEIVQTIEHPAELRYQRWWWDGGGEPTAAPPAHGWSAQPVMYDDEPIGVPYQDSGRWVFWTVETVKDAWTEPVVVQEYAPAMGDPMIEVENPGYVPATTVEHPAVECAPDRPETPQPGPGPDASDVTGNLPGPASPGLTDLDGRGTDLPEPADGEVDRGAGSTTGTDGVDAVKTTEADHKKDETKPVAKDDSVNSPTAQTGGVALAETGADTAALALLAVGLLSGGVLLAGAARKKRRAE